MAALARLGAGDASGLGEALGVAEVEAIVEPSITADQAAERIAVFRSALALTLAEQFRGLARLEVRQHGRLLARSGPGRLIPGRPARLNAAWLARVDPAGGPVSVIARA